MTATRTQDRILDAIRAEVETTIGTDGKVLTLVVDPAYANTGTLGAVRTDDVVAANRMDYAFQDDYATFKVSAAQGSPHPANAYIEYAKGPEAATERVAKVVAFLTNGITT